MPASHGACPSVFAFGLLGTCHHRRGRWHQRTSATSPRSHSRPGKELGLSGLKTVLFLQGHRALLGPDLLETDRRGPGLRLCLAECRNGLPTLRPTVSLPRSQTRGLARKEEAVYTILALSFLAGWGTPPHPHGEGCCLSQAPWVPGEGRGLLEQDAGLASAVCSLLALGPGCINIHLHSPCTRLADGGGGGWVLAGGCS